MDTHISFSEFGQVDIPNLKGYREGEQFSTSFVYLEALLKVFVFFEELRIVNDDLGIGDLELENLVVRGLCGINSPQGFFEIDVE